MLVEHQECDDRCGGHLACAPLSQDQAKDIAGLLKSLADPTRLRIVSQILCCGHAECSAGEVAQAFDVTAPTVSHHLRTLHAAGLLSRERRGTWVYYRVRSEAISALAELFGGTGEALSCGEQCVMVSESPV